jgi:hypothetical protein
MMDIRDERERQLFSPSLSLVVDHLRVVHLWVVYVSSVGAAMLWVGNCAVMIVPSLLLTNSVDWEPPIVPNAPTTANVDSSAISYLIIY